MLAMGADSANFAWFVRTVREFSKICVIRSNYVEFSADGQESESMELMWMNFVAESVRFMGIVVNLAKFAWFAGILPERRPEE